MKRQMYGRAKFDLLRQRAVQQAGDPDPLDLALSTFFLNRTNRSGIITGGVIGGKSQEGKWKIDERFKKKDLIRRIEKVGRYSSRIKLHNLDAADFLDSVAPTLPMRSLAYLDPPYYVKGQQLLYANYYGEDDHADIARRVASTEKHWVVSYDDVEEIRKLYKPFRTLSYGISYTAQDKYQGREVLVFSDGLAIPRVPNPAHVKLRDIQQEWLELSAPVSARGKT